VSFRQSAAKRVEAARVGIRGDDGIGPPILQINQAREAAALRLPVFLLRDTRPVPMPEDADIHLGAIDLRQRHVGVPSLAPKNSIPMNRAEWSGCRARWMASRSGPRSREN
jgi:hypothetical protein